MSLLINAPLFQAVLAGDDLARLAYADWLLEQGDEKGARYLREGVRVPFSRWLHTGAAMCRKYPITHLTVTGKTPRKVAGYFLWDKSPPVHPHFIIAICEPVFALLTKSKNTGAVTASLAHTPDPPSPDDPILSVIYRTRRAAHQALNAAALLWAQREACRDNSPPPV